MNRRERLAFDLTVMRVANKARRLKMSTAAAEAQDGLGVALQLIYEDL